MNRKKVLVPLIPLVLIIILLVPILIVVYTHEPREIKGQIIYSGNGYGSIHVSAIRPGEEGIKSRYNIGMDRFDSDYHIIVRTGTYTVSAYMDTNYNHEQDSDEPSGFYDSNGDGIADEITVKGEVLGIDITLYDP